MSYVIPFNSSEIFFCEEVCIPLFTFVHVCCCLQYVRTCKFTTACDMWSVGCVMLEMATGHLPWPQWAQLELAALIFQVSLVTNLLLLLDLLLTVLFA